MELPPQLAQLQLLLRTKDGRIKVGAAVVGFIIVLYLLFGGSSTPPEHVIVPLVQEPKPVVQAAPTAPPNTGNSQIILELFNPSDQALTHQLNDTSISQQIEQTMTVTFVLTKCQLISGDDYRDTFLALIAYAQQSKLSPDAASAEATVRQISESAKASYALIYSRTSCVDQQLPSLANQVMEWTRTTLKQ